MAFWNKEVKQTGFFFKKKKRAIVENVDAQMLETKTNKLIGEPHPFDLDVCEGVYAKVGMISGAVDKIVDWVFGPGFEVTSKTPKVAKALNAWIMDVNFQRHGRMFLRNALTKGTGYLELGGKKDGPVEGVRTLNPSHTYIRMKDGVVEGYTLFKGDYNRFSSDKAIPFKPYQVAHYNFKPICDCPYGYGLIFPNINKVNHHLQADDNLHTLMERKANAPLVAYMGNAEKDMLPSETDVDNMMADMTDMTETTEWAVSDLVKFEVLQFGDFGEKFDSVFRHDEDLLFFGLQIPEVLMGRGNIPEGLAKTQMDGFNRYAMSVQEDLEFIFINKIFKRVIESQGLSGDIDIVWGVTGQSETEERIRSITALLANVLLDSNLRKALEQELAALMEITYKPSPEEEREEEEESENPPLPENQTYDGTIYYEGDDRCC